MKDTAVVCLYNVVKHGEVLKVQICAINTAFNCTINISISKYENIPLISRNKNHKRLKCLRLSMKPYSFIKMQ